MILVNRVQCLNCGEIIISRYRHNYVSCKCGSTAVDGGIDYLKRTGLNYKEMSLHNLSPFEEIREVFQRYDTINHRYVYLKDMSDEWLDKVISMSIQVASSSSWPTVYIQEKQYRWEFD